MRTLLYAIFIYPIAVCMKAVFDGGYALGHSYGFALIGVCIIINSALLPLFKKSREWQEKDREIKKRIKPKADMIRRSFKGQERFVMLSTMHRQAGYRPTLGLRRYLGLLLFILLFGAAYHLFSSLPALKDAAFGPVRNLGAPDGLLRTRGMNVNILPCLMLATGFCLVFFSMRNISRMTRLLAYGLNAAFFCLVYHAPSGVAFYWTASNLYFLSWLAVCHYRRPNPGNS